MMLGTAVSLSEQSPWNPSKSGQHPICIKMPHSPRTPSVCDVNEMTTSSESRLLTRKFFCVFATVFGRHNTLPAVPSAKPTKVRSRKIFYWKVWAVGLSGFFWRMFRKWNKWFLGPQHGIFERFFSEKWRCHSCFRSGECRIACAIALACGCCSAECFFD